MKRTSMVFMLLCLLALFCLGAGLFWGSVTFSFTQFLHALLHFHATNTFNELVWQLRWPRVVAAFCVGGSLALAGALMQVLLENPLADPYVLGISGGAAVGLFIALCCGIMMTTQLQCIAWLGALLALCLLCVAMKNKKEWSSQRLLLTGIILASGWSALLSLLFVMAPSRQLPGMLFWLLGDLSRADNIGMLMLVLGLGLVGSLWTHRELDLLMRGELVARALGANVERLRWRLLGLSALLTASAVSVAGCIGFVGLLVPHVLRLLGVRRHSVLLPACVLLGGSLLTLADMLSRTLISPRELPVGVVMALLGVPTFLIVLRRSA